MTINLPRRSTIVGFLTFEIRIRVCNSPRNATVNAVSQRLRGEWLPFSLRLCSESRMSVRNERSITDLQQASALFHSRESPSYINRTKSFNRGHMPRRYVYAFHFVPPSPCDLSRAKAYSLSFSFSYDSKIDRYREGIAITQLSLAGGGGVERKTEGAFLLSYLAFK